MARIYNISKYRKMRQMMNAKKTRMRRYGHYLSQRGKRKVTANLIKARRMLQIKRLKGY